MNKIIEINGVWQNQSGSGAFSSTGADSWSLSGSGTFSDQPYANSASAASGTTSVSGAGNDSYNYTQNYNFLPTGQWQGVSGSGSTSGSGSVTTSYSASGAYSGNLVGWGNDMDGPGLARNESDAAYGYGPGVYAGYYGTDWSGSVSASGSTTQSFAYSTDSNYTPSSGWTSTGSASAESSGFTNASYSGSSPFSDSYSDYSHRETGSMSGSAAASGSDWTTYDYTQNSTLGSNGWWNAPSGSASASGGATGSISYSGSGSFTDDGGMATGSVSGTMGESGGQTYSEGYSSTATLASGATSWMQNGSGNESATSTFQYNFSGSGSGTSGPDGTGDTLSVSESGSGAGSQSYAYSGTLTDNAWTGTADVNGSSELDGTMETDDTTDSSNSHTEGGSTSSTTTDGATTSTDTGNGYYLSPPAGEVINISDQVDIPAIWVSGDVIDLTTGLYTPAMPGVYNRANSIYYIGIFGTPSLPGGVPGTVGVNGAVNSLVAQALAPAAVDAVWGMAFTPGTALSTGFAVGNTGAAGAVAKMKGADGVFGASNVSPLVPATDAALLMDYGANGVGAATNAAIFGSTFNGVIPEVCFAAGTLVLMADGSMKAIETIEVGDMVQAASESDPEGPVVARVVEEVFHNPPSALLELRVAVFADHHSKLCAEPRSGSVETISSDSVALLTPPASFVPPSLNQS